MNATCSKTLREWEPWLWAIREDAWVFCLDCLRRDSVDFHGGGSLAENQTDCTTKVSETGIIEKVCEASARYASKCEAAAFEAQQRLNEADSRPTTPVSLQAPEVAKPFPSNFDGTDRRAQVSAFLSKVHGETRVKVLRKHFWMAAGHKTPRQSAYWQAGTDKHPGQQRGATRKDDQNFRHLLAMRPWEFVEYLREKGIIPTQVAFPWGLVPVSTNQISPLLRKGIWRATHTPRTCISPVLYRHYYFSDD